MNDDAGDHCCFHSESAGQARLEDFQKAGVGMWLAEGAAIALVSQGFLAVVLMHVFAFCLGRVVGWLKEYVG